MHERPATLSTVLRRIVASAAGLFLACALSACGSGGGTVAGAPSPAGSDQAEELLFGALQNAARQQRIRVAMYRETFATEADANSRERVGNIASAVSEVDTEKAQYRSVFANNILQNDGFTVGRCVDKATYIDNYKDKSLRPKTLAEAVPHLQPAPKGSIFTISEPLIFITCPHLGLMPGGSVAMSRLSDGVLPVTLSDAQAADWAAKARAAKLFTIKDEGTVTRGGVQLRKMGFAPPQGDFTVNQKLFDIFVEAGEIEKIKREQPKAEVDYEFQSINPANSGGVGGFYLLDEAKKLPVYSELYGTNSDKPVASGKDAGAKAHNIARTKQSYDFPASLTMDVDTPLEFLD